MTDDLPAAPAAKQGFLADLFCGQGNISWELGRILTALSVLYFGVGLVWNMVLKQPVDLGPGGLGGGLGAILGGGAALVAVKTWLIEKTRQRAAAGQPGEAE